MACVLSVVHGCAVQCVCCVLHVMFAWCANVLSMAWAVLSALQRRVPLLA